MHCSELQIVILKIFTITIELPKKKVKLLTESHQRNFIRQ